MIQSPDVVRDLIRNITVPQNSKRPKKIKSIMIVRLWINEFIYEHHIN
jgi:hypothetical protein